MFHILYVFLILLTGCISNTNLNDSLIPLIERLQDTHWKVKDQKHDYKVMIRNEKIRIKLTGTLGFKETYYIQRGTDTNFTLISIYDNTESALLIGIKLINSSTIKLFVWPYTNDIPTQHAKNMLNENGKLFQRIK